jgi:hypothetical protein
MKLLDLDENVIRSLHVVASADIHFVHNVERNASGGFSQLAQRRIKVKRFSMALTCGQREGRLLDCRLDRRVHERSFAGRCGSTYGERR